MAYIDVSGGRPGWPADDQVYTHLLKARPAVVASRPGQHGYRKRRAGQYCMDDKPHRGENDIARS
jgi:hypothetical protein